MTSKLLLMIFTGLIHDHRSSSCKPQRSLHFEVSFMSFKAVLYLTGKSALIAN